MTYATGSVIQAADYNAFAGLTGTAAASSAAATSIAGYLWGIGYGDRGYGQTTPALTALTAGSVDRSWSSLQTVLADLAAWQNTSTTNLPTVAQMASGAVDQAYSTLSTFITLLDTNRLSNVAGNFTLVTTAATNTRGTTWGVSGAGITGTLTVTFTSADAARYFFNTGGQIHLNFAHPNTTTPRDTAWNTALTAIGTLIMGANSTVLSGSTDGTAGNFGYYQCGTVQTILSAVVFTSPYTTNSVTVTAVVSGTSSNGGPGNVITYTITMNDTYQGVSGPSGVQSGTNVVLGHLRAGAVLAVLPAAPTCAVGTNF